MGLRTASTEHSSTLPGAENSTENSERERLHPNESILDKMAPALTEPLNATNTLSLATASASPHPVSTNNSNSENIQNNQNNNNEDNSVQKSGNSKLSNAFAFQSVFEKAIAHKTSLPTTSNSSAAAANTFPAKSNGSNGLSMGPMCDPSANAVIDNPSSESIPVTFVNLTSDFEEDIKAEICVRNKPPQSQSDGELNTSDNHMDLQVSQANSCDESEPQPEVIKNQDEPQAKRSKSPIEIQLIQELPRINTDSTVTASEGDNENLSQLDVTEEPRSPPQHMERSPPRTPTQSNLQGSQVVPIPSLTPQSTASMVLQKDFIKDAAEMDQVLSDMDLLQVLKTFDTTPSGDNLCDLNLFNDVDVMNYEEISAPVKDVETKEIQGEILKTQLMMQRKIDFLTRRLRKFQARHMAKQATEEIAGLFEWTARLVRRKDETNRQVSYEEDKRYPVSVTAMRNVVNKIESIANDQHVSQGKKTKIARPTNTTGPAINFDKHPPLSTFVPRFDNIISENMAHVSGSLQTEMQVVKNGMDSDATISSSGGESADEAVPYNNIIQQPLSIARRAAWRYARDRGAIASRWTWLIGQIAELEFKIRQQHEQYLQIKNNKGAVRFENVAASGSETAASTSVNGYRGALPGNVKANEMETSSIDEDADEQAGACRTRALDTSVYRKRKLIQTANLHTISKKAARSSTIKCGCQWPMHPCALCTGRPDPTAPRDLPDTMMFAERVALLDPGFHPVLSFPEDVTASIHIEGIARMPDWQNRVLRCTAKSSMKGMSAAQKAAGRSLNTSQNKKGTEKRKYKKKDQTYEFLADGSGPSTPVLANKTTKMSSKRSHPRNADSSNHHPAHSSSNYQTNSTKNKTRKVSSSTTLNGSQFGDMNGLHCDSIDGTVNGIAVRSRTSSPTHHHKSDRTYEKKPKELYDIDNIVIPYSVAASTRVEHLPYKEIPTPKWRIIGDDDDDDDPQEETSTHSAPMDIQELFDTVVPSAKEDSSDKKPLESYEAPSDPTPATTATETEPTQNEDEVEDVSDEAILSRHERALIEERRKFQTFLKFPWSTRSRANRRIDSRTESSGANTPDPTSPAPNTANLGGDHESIPSPAAPSTPLDPTEESIGNLASIGTMFNAMARRNERKRTVSTKKDDHLRRSTTPDFREWIPPFEPLHFPLSDDQYEEMLKIMPGDHTIIEDCTKTGLAAGTEASTITSEGDKSINNNFEHKTGDDDEEMKLEEEAKELFPIPIGEASSILALSCDQDLAALDKMFSAEHRILAGSDTESVESGVPDDDPNDPEWKEEPE